MPEAAGRFSLSTTPSIRDADATALRYEGFSIEEASDGMEALRAVRRREPDLIVLDWMSPTSTEVRSVDVFASRASRTRFSS